MTSTHRAARLSEHLPCSMSQRVYVYTSKRTTVLAIITKSFPYTYSTWFYISKTAHSTSARDSPTAEKSQADRLTGTYQAWCVPSLVDGFNFKKERSSLFYFGPPMSFGPSFVLQSGIICLCRRGRTKVEKSKVFKYYIFVFETKGRPEITTCVLLHKDLWI